MEILMRVLRVYVGAGLALWCAAGALAEEPDRLEPHMTVVGVTLERTTLLEAQRLLGRADLRHNGGDAAASASAECYVGPDGTALALLSNSEMGGGTTITEYQLVSREALADYSGDTRYVVPRENRPRCAILTSLSRSTATTGGLRLGLPIEDLRRLLGDPSEVSADHVVFSSEARVPMTAEQKKAFEAYNSPDRTEDFMVRGRLLRIELAGGKVIAIRASQVTST